MSSAQARSQEPEARNQKTYSAQGIVRLWQRYFFLIMLAFCLFAICGACVVAAPQRIARSVDAGDAERFFYGLGGREQNATGSFRWSGGDWGVALFGAAYPSPTLVTVHASATRPAGVPEAQLRLVGTPASAAFPMSREPRRYRLLARPVDDPHDRQRIAFTGTTFTPDGSDGRALGIAISQVELVQLGAAPWLPMVARSLFLASLAFGLAVAVRQLGAPRSVSLGSGVVAAAALGGFHLFSPQTLGFFLPSVWLMLAGAGALVWGWGLAACGWGLRNSPAMQRRVVVSFGAALVGTLALWLQLLPVALGLTLAVGGALFAVLVGNGRRTTDDGRRTTDKPSGFRLSSFVFRLSTPATALILITLVALAARLYRLNEQPLALWRDEVYHAELALRIWRDSSFRPMYVPEVDLPALLFYLIAPPIGLFGADYWTLRLVPALAGTLTPLALWFAVRPLLGQRVALIAAWCMAVSAWSLYMSRWTFPVIFDPLFTLLAIGCLLRGLRRGRGDREARRYGDAETGREFTAFLPPSSSSPTVLGSPVRLMLCGLGGFFAGLVVYTYHTGRIEPLVIVLVVAAGIWQGRSENREPRTENRESRTKTQRVLGFLIFPASCLFVFLITIAPLALFALNNPDAFSKRFTTVSIFNGPDAAPTAPLTVLDDQIARHALMWHVRGDQNARHYAPFRPMLDPFSGALLLVGVGVCLLRIQGSVGRDPGPNTSLVLPRRGGVALTIVSFIVLTWLAIGLVPGILSDVAPHAMRTIGALAPACVLVAVGLDWLLQRLFYHQDTQAQRAQAGYLFAPSRLHVYVIAAFLAATAVWNLGVYFGITGEIGENYYAFETQRSLFARAARTTLAEHPNISVYLPTDFREGKAGQTTTLLLNAAPVGWLDGTRLTPPARETALVLVPGDSEPAELAAAQQALGPASRLLRSGPPIPNQTAPIYRIYGVGRDAQAIADAMRLP